ncbi:MAG: hypothetical protein IJB39_07120 [Alistipes sp.]|nr:hypothetical protein [Alistipes sp.]
MKLKVIGIVLLQVILIILNILFFMWTGPERSSVVWLSYAFSTIAYLILEAAILVPRDYKSSPWSWSIIYIATMLFISELIIGIIFGCLVTSITWAITIQLLLLLGFMIWGYMHISATVSSSRALKKQAEESIYAKEVALQVKGLIALVSDASTRKVVKSLYEKIWCSPRSSNNTARSYESRVTAGVEELKILVAEANWVEVERLSNELLIIADQRNSMLK